MNQIAAVIDFPRTEYFIIDGPDQKGVVSLIRGGERFYFGRPY